MPRGKKNRSIEELIELKINEINNLTEQIKTANDELDKLKTTKQQKDLEAITKAMEEYNLTPEQAVDIIKDKMTTEHTAE